MGEPRLLDSILHGWHKGFLKSLHYGVHPAVERWLGYVASCFTEHFDDAAFRYIVSELHLQTERGEHRIDRYLPEQP